MCVEFTIPGTPVAKGRPRFVVRNGFASTYTPKKTAGHEAVVALYAKRAFMKPLVGPLRLEVISFHPVPKGMSKTDKQGALLGTLRPAQKPDIDNIAKLVLDAMNGVAYVDDKQVVEVEAKKFYGIDPRTVVRVYRLAA